MNNTCCRYIGNRCDCNDFYSYDCYCCCNCLCCDCTDIDFIASDGRIPAINMHPVFGNADTVLWGSYRYDIYSDGVTVDLSEHEIPGYVELNDITITSIKLTVMFLFFDGVCQPNEIDYSFGLFEALGYSKIFRLIPESKIVFDKKVMPPFDRSRYDKTLDGLNIKTSRNNRYFFGLHYMGKTTGDRGCGLILRPFGSYTFV